MEQPEFAKWWILPVCQKGKPHSALVNKGLWKLRNKMINVQYTVVVLQVNVGLSVFFVLFNLVCSKKEYQVYYISCHVLAITHCLKRESVQLTFCHSPSLPLKFFTFNKQSKTFGGRF